MERFSRPHWRECPARLQSKMLFQDDFPSMMNRVRLKQHFREMIVLTVVFQFEQEILQTFSVSRMYM